MLDDHIRGSRIPSIAIQLRSIEEIFCQTWMDQDRSTHLWIAIKGTLDSGSPAK